MRLMTSTIVLLALAAGGCQALPPTSTDYAAGNRGQPCGFRAVDNGMCPYVGYRNWGESPAYR